MSKNLSLDAYLKRLRLPTVMNNYARLSQEAVSSGIDYEGYLSCLLEMEIAARDESMQKIRLRQAGFPAVKTLDGFDFGAIPSLNKSLVLELHRGNYLADGSNVILLGNIGTGKSHLAVSLGAQACLVGKKVRFSTVANLATELIEAHDERRLTRLKQQLARVDLLILDELGMVPFHKDGASMLFQIINERYERHSTIITTNYKFPEWTQFFGSQQLTAALLDRLTHRCHILEMNGESYRFKESLQRKKKDRNIA